MPQVKPNAQTLVSIFSPTAIIAGNAVTFATLAKSVLAVYANCLANKDWLIAQEHVPTFRPTAKTVVLAVRSVQLESSAPQALAN